MFEDNTFEDFVFILPKGTLGILLKIVVDKSHEEYAIGFPNPVTGTIFASTIQMKANDFTIDVSSKEKESIIKSHAKYITARMYDNLEAMKTINETREFDIRKKLDEQNT